MPAGHRKPKMAISTAEAVAITAATMLILSGICFYFFYHYVIMTEKRRIIDSSLRIRREDAIKDTDGNTFIQKNDLQLLYFRNLIKEEDQKRVDNRFNDPRIMKQSEEDGSKCNHQVQKKMKPLIWQKVDIDADHPVIWNEIANGSLRFDDELIETLFGYDANKSYPKFGSLNSTPSDRISILNPTRSHITSIALKALAISRKELLDAVTEGRGLSRDVLEKLSKILPTEEEVSKILQFTGNPTKLPEAESFFYHILKAMPTAFTRIDMMLFQANFNPEMLQLKEWLETIELGCKELQTPGVFWKLLEAILKVGNRMNAGTPRGNAKGFKLISLQKVYYVRSNSYMKTGLLNFVVEQVVIAEGKNMNSRSDIDSDTMIENDEKYLMLGLPVFKRLLSRHFSNMKKAKMINYFNLIRVIPNLSERVSKIREMVMESNGGDGFVKEMKEFVELSEEQFRVIRKEETRVMEVLRKTRDFYKIEDSISNSPLVIFGIVWDFLEKVDKVCVDLTKKVERIRLKKIGFPNYSTNHLNNRYYLI